MKYALFLSLLGVCSAQEIHPLLKPAAMPHPDAVQQQGVEFVVPELIIGGEWTSTIRLTNRGTKPIALTNVYFWDNAANPLVATFQASDGSTVTGPGFSFFLGVGAITEATFVGGANTLFGHATVDCSSAGICGTPGLYAEVTLRNHNATRPDFVSVFPLEEPAPLQYMLFDGRNGITTTLYLVNNTLGSTIVLLDVIDSSNNLLRTVPISMNAGESQILTLHVLSPETIGIQGTLAIHGTSTAAVYITATALRIDPSNSFTPMRAFIPSP
jgi:hypothetical protein